MVDATLRFLSLALFSQRGLPIFCAAYVASRLYTILLNKTGSDRQALRPLHALHSFSGRIYDPMHDAYPAASLIHLSGLYV